MGTRPPPFMTSSSCNSSPLVSRAVLRKTMRAPESGLSIVSPALAMMLLPFPQTDIVPPKVVQCMLRNHLRNPYSPECVEERYSEVRQESFKDRPLGLHRSSRCCCIGRNRSPQERGERSTRDAPPTDRTPNQR